MIRLTLTLTTYATLLAGCGIPVNEYPEPGTPIPIHSQFYEAECALGTQASDGQQFHALIHYPTEHSLRVPGMVVGIEKSADHLVKRGADIAASKQLTKRSDDKFVFTRVFGGNKYMFISHVFQTDADGFGVEEAVYNVYKHKDAKRIREAEARPNSPVDCHGRPVADLDAFGDSWHAIQKIKTTLATDLTKGDYTDVLVISMGWNTNQIEAVQNFNSLIHQLKKVANPKENNLRPHLPKDSFRPYVIGVTWPSEWTNSWVEPAVRAISLGNKANDADEVGAGWLGAIIQHGVLSITQAKKDKPLRVTVLGHSFGARATSMAVCRGSILTAPKGMGFDDKLPLPGAVNWLIGLQGAYSLNRYLPKGAGPFVNLRYEENCPTANRMLLTASENDTAADFSSNILLSAPFAGQIETWKAMQDSEHSSMFDFHLADASGQVTLQKASNTTGGSRWEYVNASGLIFYKAYGTGAGAHSDIYRPEMGKFLWGFINSSESLEVTSVSKGRSAGDQSR